MNVDFRTVTTELLVSWRQSVAPFAWHELRTTCLFIINLCRLAGNALLQKGFSGPLLSALFWAVLLSIFVPLLGVVVVAVLFIRPSVGLKDRDYLFEKLFAPQRQESRPHKKIMTPFVLTAGLLFLVDRLMMAELAWSTVPLAMCPFVIVWLFFLFDAPAEVAEAWITCKKAFRMVLSQAPYFFVMYGVFWWVATPLFAFMLPSAMVQACFTLCLIPLYVAAIGYGYIGELRRNFGKYDDNW